MEQYIQYILEKDRELVFHPDYETQVIETVLGDTEGYQKLKAEHAGERPLPVGWVVRTDLDLAKFSFQMFIRSKKIMLNDIDYESFQVLWDNYIQTPDYFIQVANYMINNDDYTSGARIKLQSEEVEVTNFPEGNLGPNMKELQASFQGNPIGETQYVQKVGKLGTELFKMIQQ